MKLDYEHVNKASSSGVVAWLALQQLTVERVPMARAVFYVVSGHLDRNNTDQMLVEMNHFINLPIEFAEIWKARIIALRMEGKTS